VANSEPPVAAPAPYSNPNYDELFVVRDPDGVCAVVTEHKQKGWISFGLYREFDRDGKPTRSAYLMRRHVAAVRRLLDDLEERLELEEDRARAKRRSAE
jgi:hypothetical protein